MARIVLQTQGRKGAVTRQAPARQGFGRRLKAALAGCVAAGGLLAGHAFAQEGPQRLQAITLGLGILNIKAEVALSAREHEIGLMNRTSMGANEGMLFVFDRPGVQCFWMKNTLIPLSVAFLADDGTIVNVDEMKAQTLDSHCSAKPVRYVLEMNTGWFKRHGAKPGDKLAGQPFGTPR
ncbi:MAG: hypothetical protein RI907_3467 [Pseudomonadota bacterium]|jgi:uncharacterized membrane protein (UPF0127 family)